MSKKLLVAFTVTVAVVLAMCVTVTLAMNRQAVLEQYNSASDEVQIDMERARGDIYHASADVRRYVLTGEASAKPDLDGIFTEFNAQMDSIRRLSQRAPELQPYFDGMSAAATAWRKDVAEAELAAMAEAGGREKAIAIVAQGQTTERMDALTKATDTAMKNTKVWVDNDTAVQAAGLRTVKLVLLIGGALTTLIAAGMGMLLTAPWRTRCAA
ncbi:MAG: CHASE3 domain-containing protein [Caulobacteraceae bacterium]